MDEGRETCAVCDEYGRLHCADCQRTFCVEHLERHFAMGYFYLCAACAALRRAAEPVAKAPPKRARPRKA